MAAQRAPGDFGGKLRAARERRGLSLRQIANATKISIITLEALERNDIARLPGGIFSRAFVRSYAAEVGLDPEATIEEFMGQFPHDSVTAGHPTSAPIEDHAAVESDRRMATTVLRLVLISVPIAGVVLYFATAGRPSRRAADLPVVSTAPTGPGRAETPAAVELAPAVADRLVVHLLAKSACHVSTSLDGEPDAIEVLQPGAERSFEVRRSLVLRVDDASAVRLMLNGEVAKPLGGKGEAITARLDPANFRQFLLNP